MYICTRTSSSIYLSMEEYWNGCHALLQGIFPTQGLNPGLPHCRHILYHLGHQGNTRILERVAYPIFGGISSTQESNWDLLHCRVILYQLSYQESPYSYHSFFIHSLVKGPMNGCFHVLTAVNSAAMNTRAHVSFQLWFS